MIVLASTSLTRQSILRNASVEFDIVAPHVDERALVEKNPQWSPADISLQLAAAKAHEVSQRHPGRVVIGADQVLALNDKVYSKPRDQAQCRDQLMALRGKTHLLFSGIAIARDNETMWSHLEPARLTMRDFTDDFLAFYLKSVGDDCTSSVGGYKIEGPGIQLFRLIEGDHSTILGLPLLPLLQQLRDIGELRS